MLSIYLSLHKQGGLVKTWKEIEQIEEYNPIYSLSIYLSIYLERVNCRNREIDRVDKAVSNSIYSLSISIYLSGE